MDPDERTRRTYDAVAETYHERTRDIDALLPAMDRFIDRLPTEPQVLDAGCGPGRDARHLAERGAAVVGLDFATGQLQVAADHAPDARLVQGDLRRPPLEQDSVDGVWATASLIHVPLGDVERALTGLRRVCRPGGALFVSMKPGPDGAEERAGGYGTDTGRYVVTYAPAAFADRLRDAGFAVDEESADDDWFTIHARAGE